jgi:hypothetical protein
LGWAHSVCVRHKWVRAVAAIVGNVVTGVALRVLLWVGWYEVAHFSLFRAG